MSYSLTVNGSPFSSYSYLFSSVNPFDPVSGQIILNCIDLLHLGPYTFTLTGTSYDLLATSSETFIVEVINPCSILTITPGPTVLVDYEVLGVNTSYT